MRRVCVWSESIGNEFFISIGMFNLSNFFAHVRILMSNAPANQSCHSCHSRSHLVSIIYPSGYLFLLHILIGFYSIFFFFFFFNIQILNLHIQCDLRKDLFILSAIHINFGSVLTFCRAIIWNWTVNFNKSIKLIGILCESCATRLNMPMTIILSLSTSNNIPTNLFRINRSENA